MRQVSKIATYEASSKAEMTFENAWIGSKQEKWWCPLIQERQRHGRGDTPWRPRYSSSRTNSWGWRTNGWHISRNNNIISGSALNEKCLVPKCQWLANRGFQRMWISSPSRVQFLFAHFSIFETRISWKRAKSTWQEDKAWWSLHEVDNEKLSILEDGSNRFGGNQVVRVMCTTEKKVSRNRRPLLEHPQRRRRRRMRWRWRLRRGTSRSTPWSIIWATEIVQSTAGWHARLVGCDMVVSQVD